jgi:hypothetical protein
MTLISHRRSSKALLGASYTAAHYSVLGSQMLDRSAMTGHAWLEGAVLPTRTANTWQESR